MKSRSHSLSKFLLPAPFFSSLPRITSKNSQIPHPAKTIVDPSRPGGFPLSRNFTCVCTHVNFNHVNKIEARYIVLRLNAQLSEVQILRLRAILYSFANVNTWGGGYSTNFYKGRLRPELQPLTLLYLIFHEKGTPFVYLLLTNGTPFTYLVQNFASLLTDGE